MNLDLSEEQQMLRDTVRNFARGGVNPIDPTNLDHVRADVFTDGRITAADNGLVRNLASEGLDGTGLLLLFCP